MELLRRTYVSVQFRTVAFEYHLTMELLGEIYVKAQFHKRPV